MFERRGKKSRAHKNIRFQFLQRSTLTTTKQHQQPQTYTLMNRFGRDSMIVKKKVSREQGEYIFLNAKREAIQERKKKERKRMEEEAQENTGTPCVPRAGGVYQGSPPGAVSTIPHITTHKARIPAQSVGCPVRTNTGGIPPVPRISIPRKFR